MLVDYPNANANSAVENSVSKFAIIVKIQFSQFVSINFNVIESIQ